MKHHFVQFDLAWLKNHRDHRDIFDFKNKIDPIHELAVDILPAVNDGDSYGATHELAHT